MFCKGESWSKDSRIRLDECITLAFNDRRWNGFAFEFPKLGLVVKEFELAGSTCHEDVYDTLGFDGKSHEVWLRSSSHGFFGKKGSEGDFANADSTILEELAASTME